MSLFKKLSDLQTKLESIEGAAALVPDLQQVLDLAAPYDGLDPKQAREAISKLPELERMQQTLSQTATERDQFKTAADDLSQRVSALATDVVVERGLGMVGALPNYRDLVAPAVRALVETGDSGPVLPDGFADRLREQYPAMFAPTTDAAGVGVGETGAVTPPSPSQVTANSGVVRVNPHDVRSGKVAIAG